MVWRWILGLRKIREYYRGCGGSIRCSLEFTLGCSPTQQVITRIIVTFFGDLESLVQPELWTVGGIASNCRIQHRWLKIAGLRQQIILNFALALLLISIFLWRDVSQNTTTSIYTGHACLLLIEQLEGLEYQAIPSKGNTRTKQILLVRSLAQQIFKWSSTSVVFLCEAHMFFPASRTTSLHDLTMQPELNQKKNYSLCSRCIMFSQNLWPKTISQGLIIDDKPGCLLKLFQGYFILQLIIDSRVPPRVSRKYRRRFLQDGGL